MNRTLISVATFLVLAAAAIGALTEEQLSALKQKLANSDPIVRREGLEKLLLKENPKTAGNDIVPLLCSALADQDAKVRALAAATLAAISVSTLPKFNQPNAKVTDLKNYRPLQAALVAAFNDPDEETRKNALGAYALTFAVPPAVQNALVTRYESERQYSLFRAAILEALTIDGAPTPAAKVLLVRVADNPNDSVHLAQVTLDSKAPPIELLPHFATQFNSTSDGPSRAMFARAIGKFGPAAKPYVSMLQRAADLESDEITKQTLTKAVAAIEAAK
jgi:hypothetical protein